MGMAELTSQKTLIRTAGVALGVGGAHYAAHKYFGEKAAFGPAGVMQAGIAASLTGAAAVAFFEARDTN